jgi:hypothetical protein
MEVSGRVTAHNADDEKEKYIATIMGITSDLTEIKIKLQSSKDDLLKKYPRGAEFEVTIKQSKEKQAQLQR